MHLNSTGTDVPGAPPPAPVRTMDSQPIISTNQEEYEKILIEIDREHRWDLTSNGIVSTQRKEGEPRIAERIHTILSYFHGIGFDNIELPIGGNRLRGFKRINNMIALDCYHVPSR